MTLRLARGHSSAAWVVACAQKLSLARSAVFFYFLPDVITQLNSRRRISHLPLKALPRSRVHVNGLPTRTNNSHPEASFMAHCAACDTMYTWTLRAQQRSPCAFGNALKKASRKHGALHGPLPLAALSSLDRGEGIPHQRVIKEWVASWETSHERRSP
jgi:hypothetical protein